MIVELYDSIYRLLAEDEMVLNYLQVDTGLPEEELALAKALKIQRQREPQELMEGLPMQTFYSLPSSRDYKNYRVYNALFMFDTYTQNDVNKALMVSKRLYGLLNESYLNTVNTGVFKAEWLDGYESPTNDPDSYCFTNVFSVSMVLDE